MGPWIDGRTRVIGVIGWPIEHTLSPRMFNAAFLELGLNYCYVPFQVVPGNLVRAVDGLRGLGILGASVTRPYKEAIVSLVDKLNEVAGSIGAVNVVVNESGILVGYNTDHLGITEALKREGGIAPFGKRVAVFGAGGAARAAAFGLLWEGASEVVIFNRTEVKGRTLATELAERIPYRKIRAMPLTIARESIQEFDVVINATSVGMAGEEPRLQIEPCNLRTGMIVLDLVYNPPVTPLLRVAREKGCVTVSGLAVLVYQAAASFSLWTGLTPPIETMKEAVGLSCLDFR